MKKLFVAIAILMFVPGCSGLSFVNDANKAALDNHKEFMSKIPNNEFAKFEYHRNGFYSSANLTALGAEKTGNELTINSISYDAKYGPESISITLEGYKRDFSPEGVFVEEKK